MDEENAVFVAAGLLIQRLGPCCPKCDSTLYTFTSPASEGGVRLLAGVVSCRGCFHKWKPLEENNNPTQEVK